MHKIVKRRITRVSESRRKAANSRWKRDHARRDELATRDPIMVGGRIVRRIIVIDHETTVRERTIYEHDSAEDWKRKVREVMR